MVGRSGPPGGIIDSRPSLAEGVVVPTPPFPRLSGEAKEREGDFEGGEGTGHIRQRYVEHVVPEGIRRQAEGGEGLQSQHPQRLQAAADQSEEEGDASGKTSGLRPREEQGPSLAVKRWALSVWPLQQPRRGLQQQRSRPRRVLVFQQE